jgi:xanthine dehydrogenase YagS FAD-binding subunit
MRPIRYLKVTDTGSAIAATRGHPDAAFLAGGTSLIDLMKLGVLNPAELVDVNALPLSQITLRDDGALEIGAMVRNSDLAYHPEVIARFPLLSEALLAGASAQLRNMATVGGNLLQRTRCYYFRDLATPCNKREPGSGCGALDGYNRNNAILGTSEKCIAAHPSDMCVAMVALDAVVHVHGPDGEREVPIVELHVLPGDHPERESVLQPGELITAVRLPGRPAMAQSRYVKVRDRASYAFALTSAAATLSIAGGQIREARVALGGVGTKPWRSVDAERVLVGKPANRATFALAAAAAVESARPRKHNAFKVELVRRTLVRALSSVKGVV